MTGMRAWLRVLSGTLMAWAMAVAPAVAGETAPFLKGSFDAIRAAHGGRPVIIHLWGLTCGPCLVELPEWGRFAAAHPGVPLVLISADRAAALPDPRLEAVRAKAGLSTVQSYAFADRFEDRLRFEIDPSWMGDLPRTLLIAGDGTVTVLPGVADMARVSAWIAAQK